MKNKWWKNGAVMMSLLVLPASGNYKLEGFTFGGGGGVDLGSSNYSVQGRVGQLTNNGSVGNSFGVGAGLAFERQSGQPNVPGWTNDGNYTNKLKLIIDNTNFASDYKYAVAISNDNFVTTKYVKSTDYSVGDSLGVEDFLTYAQWGGSEGIYVVGLEMGVTYSVKVSSMQGRYSQSGWSETVSAATEMPILVFDLDTGAADAETSPPYEIDLGDVEPGVVATSNSRVWVDLETNVGSGASVHLYGKNGGLYSSLANFNIGSTTANLDVAQAGFGVQVVGVGQSEGGPITAMSPFDGGGNVVGNSDGVVKAIFSSSGAVVGGRGSFVVKVKASNQTPAASDYSEVFTVVASANF